MIFRLALVLCRTIIFSVRFWAVLAVLLLRPAPIRAAPDLSGIFYEQKLGATLPLDASFQDQRGMSLKLGTAMGGKPTALALGYYACPTLCGVVRNDAAVALARSGLVTPRDYTLVVLSIDPHEHASDAAQAMDRVLADNPVKDAQAGWHFLTGRMVDIAAVERAVGFHARYDTILRQFLHPAGIVIVTAEGRVSSYVLGVGYSPGDVRAGLLRAGAGTVAERAAEPILLLCLHYDPATGRYSLAIMKLLRIAAVMTVLGVGGLLLLAE